jgi:UDP-N-acetylmuramoyl-L-alanyl-D-glutamate--2,6-diaminopimelate ligase
MLLHDLFYEFDAALDLTGIPQGPVAGVRDDSRLVKPGDLFVARPGSQTDGNRFITDAAARGAIAIVAESKRADITTPQIVVPCAAKAAGLLAQIFRQHPSRKVKTIGITGTNGKTTTTYLIRHLLNRYRQKCGLIGTVEIDDGRTCREAAMTTPGACELADLLADMRDHQTFRCAMEVSSHALDQHRVAGIEFAAAGFTNLTGDHLDYHKTMDAYAAAKARLFASLDATALAVLNADDKWSAVMAGKCFARVIRYGFMGGADYQARDIKIDSTGSHFILVAPDGRVEVAMGLIGRHNIENALLAAALVCETFGLTVHQVAAGLKDAAGAPGRLQPVRKGQPFGVLVDYAHTDDALDNVLSALRPLVKGKLRVVFGCGGDRDATKRPRMAQIAEKWADVIYVTSDNPRTEDPHKILEQITTGFAAPSTKKIYRQVDRALAIEQALNDAQAWDVVLLAGKGHENYQIVGTERRHFDDAEEAARVLAERFAPTAR